MGAPCRLRVPGRLQNHDPWRLRHVRRLLPGADHGRPGFQHPGREPVYGSWRVLTAIGITMDASRPDSGHAQASTSNDALNACSPRAAITANAAGTCPDPLSLACATDGVFTRPTFISVAHSVKLPTYEEWSLAVERQIARNTVFSAVLHWQPQLPPANPTVA